jgi:hypothetical protein
LATRRLTPRKTAEAILRGKVKIVAKPIRGAKVGARLRVEPAGETPYITTLRDFLLDNEEDRDLRSEVLHLEVGKAALLGGGAVPVVKVTRVS